MSDHINGHRMHGNSLRVFSESTEALSQRARECYCVLAQSMVPLTDRDVMEDLNFTDMNAVRPRLSELVDDLWLEEVDSVIDRTTGKRVRRLRALTPFSRAAKLRRLLAERDQKQLQLEFA